MERGKEDFNGLPPPPATPPLTINDHLMNGRISNVFHPTQRYETGKFGEWNLEDQRAGLNNDPVGAQVHAKPGCLAHLALFL